MRVILFITTIVFLSFLCFAGDSAGDSCQECHKTRPGGEIGDTCKNCHPRETAELAKSKKSFLSCVACHGAKHHAPGMPTGNPAFAAYLSCKPCHKEQMKKYENSKHYQAWPALNAIKAYDTVYSKKASGKGCVPCHEIGRQWDDGTRGRCNYCHTPHLFSKKEARQPESCRMCHAGDQPQYEAWTNSTHGAIHDIEGDTGRAPTCVTCHDAHEVITAWGFLGIRGPGGDEDEKWKKARETLMGAMDVIGLTNSPKAFHSYEEWLKLRTKMIGRCEQCHVASFVKKEMESNDQFLRELDLDTADIINAINSIELLKNDENARMALYYNSIITRIESFIGAFHNSPSQAWDHGYFKLYPQFYIASKSENIHETIGRTRKRVTNIAMYVAILVVIVLIIIALCFFLLFRHQRRFHKSSS